MFIPIWLLIIIAIVACLFFAWAILAANGRNPLPVPDPGSRIFTTSSPAARAAIVELLGIHGVRQRFRMDSSGIERSIMWDGTIVNYSPEEILRKVDGATACIGLVSDDPEASAISATEFLRQRGFAARVVLNVEPNFPVAFVLTDALRGKAINFRKHIMKMPGPN